MNIDKLKTEIDTDPLARGYSGMTDAEVVVSLNDTIDREVNKDSLTGTEILNSFVKADFLALTDVKKQAAWNVIHMGTINPFGVEADVLIDAFGAGSATIIALAALRKDTVSRANELGIGKVREGNVKEVRV